MKDTEYYSVGWVRPMTYEYKFLVLSDVSGFCLFVLFCFSRQGFPVALEPVLELALVDYAGLKLTEIHLPLPPGSPDIF